MRTCKAIVKGDSIAVYAVEDCHRMIGELIDAGLLIKGKSGKWEIKDADNSEDNLDGQMTIDFKKKIFYTP